MIWIEMQVDKGDRIDRACEAAVRMAGMTGVGVRFTFNDVELTAMPDDSPGDVLGRYGRYSRERAEVSITGDLRTRGQLPKDDVESDAEAAAKPPTLDELGEIAWEACRGTGSPAMFAANLPDTRQLWHRVAKAIAERLGHHIEELP